MTATYNPSPPSNPRPIEVRDVHGVVVLRLHANAADDLADQLRRAAVEARAAEMARRAKA